MDGEDIYVENMRVHTRTGVAQVWSKKHTGRATSLLEALTLSTLRDAISVAQMELAIPLDPDQPLVRLFKALGVRHLRVYEDPSPPYNGRLKIEFVLGHSSPLKPNIVEWERWFKIRQIVECLARALPETCVVTCGLVGRVSTDCCAFPCLWTCVTGMVGSRWSVVLVGARSVCVGCLSRIEALLVGS